MRIIPRITHYDQFDGKLAEYAKDISFVVFEPENNYYSVAEMAEIYAATLGGKIDESALDLISFRPQRIIAQEIIIALTLKVQLHDLKEDLAGKFNLVKNTINIDEFTEFGDALWQTNIDAAKYSNNDDIQFLSIYAPGKYIAGITDKEVRRLIKANKWTTPTLRKLARAVIESAVDGLIQAGEFKALTEYALAERITFTVSGAIASGKGALEGLMQDHVKDLGKSWDDIMKINGDSYKPLLDPICRYKASKQRLILYSQLVQDDITVMGKEINRRLLERIKATGKAPHAFIDKSFINELGLEIALIGGGKLTGFMASLSVEAAIARAEARGDSTGRFEDTYQILEAHSNIADKFVDLLLKYKGADITYTMFDNDVAKGEQPIKVAEVDLKAARLLLYDEARFLKFLNKSNLDAERSLIYKEIVYKDNADSPSSSFTGQLVSAGYEIFAITHSYAA